MGLFLVLLAVQKAYFILVCRKLFPECLHSSVGKDHIFLSSQVRLLLLMKHVCKAGPFRTSVQRNGIISVAF